MVVCRPVGNQVDLFPLTSNNMRPGDGQADGGG